MKEATPRQAQGCMPSVSRWRFPLSGFASCARSRSGQKSAPVYLSPGDLGAPRFCAILSARTILITITGQAKRDLLEKAIADVHSSTLPIGRGLAECDQPIDIHWAP